MSERSERSTIDRDFSAVGTTARSPSEAKERAMAKHPRPAGHHTVTPGFIVPSASKVLDFVQKAFGGKVVDKYEGPGGTIGHCEVMIGDSVVMFGDPQPGFEPMPASLSVYVDEGKDVDATYRR